MTMKDARVAELKAKLSEYLRFVRKGNEVTVYDRNEPIARLIPYTANGPLVVREAVQKYESLRDVHIPRHGKLASDPVEALLEDRNSGR
jgi:prevent-host-death family protein